MPGNLPSLDEIPPEVLASWPYPDYDDPVSRSWMPEYAGTLQGVATILVLARLYLRLRNRAGAFGLDDALLILGFVTGAAFTGLAIVGCTGYGSNLHIWDIPPSRNPHNALIAWLSEIFFFLSTCSTKVSVLLFYRRIVHGTFSRKWKWATLTAIAFTVAYGFTFIMTLIFNCSPVEAYWKAFSLEYTKDYHCHDTKALNPLTGVLSVVSDLYSVLLPMGMLWNFETDRRKKIALNAVFSLGMLVVAAGAVRTYYLWQLGHNYDITWTGFNVFVWSQLEIQLALVCASAPTLRVLFKQYLRDPITRAMHTSSRPSGNRSVIHDSKPQDFTTIATAESVNGAHRNGSLPDDYMFNHYAKTYIGEEEIEEPYHIKTAEEFEVYALQNLENARRHTREGSDTSRPKPVDSLSDQRTPKSWLDVASTD